MILSRAQILKAKLRFTISFFRFKSFLSKLNLSNDIDPEKTSYVIVLSTWFFNSTAWFSIATGILLYRRKHNIVYLINDLRTEKKINHYLQIKLFYYSLNFARKFNIKVEFLSSYNTNENISELDNKVIKDLAFANAVHTNRGEESSAFFRNLEENYYDNLKKSFPSIKNYISSNLNNVYIFPGGISSNSGIFVHLLNKYKTPYFTFDSGFAVLLSTHNGISAQFSDIPTALNLLLNGDVDRKNKAIDFANNEFQNRRNGTNKLNSQYQSFENSEIIENVGILIPLNSPWDSAALNISSVFNTYNDWLLSIVGLILENSSYNITIRQHPDERYWWGKTKTDFNALLMAKYNSKRIQFVTCYDKVNSYVLLNNADAVVCYSSTFGIEASMSGKPVCVCSNVYYSNLGFSFKPVTVDDVIYFVKNLKQLSFIASKEAAPLAYYLGQKCNWLFTDFTPAMHDFVKWCKFSIEDIENDQVVQIYLQSLTEQKPVSYINHLHFTTEDN